MTESEPDVEGEGQESEDDYDSEIDVDEAEQSNNTGQMGGDPAGRPRRRKKKVTSRKLW